jgi:hypothetical protein
MDRWWLAIEQIASRGDKNPVSVFEGFGRQTALARSLLNLFSLPGHSPAADALARLDKAFAVLTSDLRAARTSSRSFTGDVLAVNTDYGTLITSLRKLSEARGHCARRSLPLSAGDPRRGGRWTDGPVA